VEGVEWNTAVGREVKVMSVIILSSMDYLPWPEYTECHNSWFLLYLFITSSTPTVNSWTSLAQYIECVTVQVIEKLGLIRIRSRDFFVFPFIHTGCTVMQQL
jgi:hypothetical protein